MKKSVKILAIGLVFVLLCCFGLTGCFSKHEHEWKTDVWTYDNTYHWRACKYCLKKNEKGKHTFENGRCTVCGWQKDVIPEQPHEHDWSEEWYNNNDYHWHECSGCDEKGDYGEHRFDENYECFCGRATSRPHEWVDEYSMNDTHHWHDCNECDETLFYSEHNFEQGDCYCGHPHVHKWATELNSDPVRHWYDCTYRACDGMNERVAHDYSNGQCVCGRTKPTVTEGLQFEQCDGGYKVTGIGTATATELVIPSEYEGEAVVAVDSSALSRLTELTYLEIPDSVTKIGDSAFYGCTGLESIVIGGGVAEIGTFAFLNDSKSLTSIVVSENNSAYKSVGDCLLTKDGTHLILGCRNSVVPDTVTHLERAAFSNCRNMRKLNLPDSVISVAMNTFDDCRELEYNEYLTGCYLGTEENPYAVLVKGVTDAVYTLEVHKKTRVITEAAFYGNLTITSVFIGTNVQYFSNSEERSFPIFNSDRIETITVSLRALNATTYGLGVKKAVLLDGEELSNNEFSGLPKLEEVVLPDGIKRITKAMNNCPKLAKVTLSNDLEEVGYETFDNCPSLQYTVYNHVRYLGSEKNKYLLVMGEQEITHDIRLVEYARVIKAKAFTGNRNWSRTITSIRIPKGLISITRRAFDESYILFDRVVEKIYYEGTPEEWEKIAIDNEGGYNDPLLNAERYYYSKEQPTDDGNYWHYNEEYNIVEW